MYASEISGWIGFLSVATGVMATLSGLIFVAVSINLSRILEEPGLSDRAAEAILQLLGALIICMLALAPNQSRVLLGCQIAIGGLIIWTIQIRLQYRSSVARRRRPVVSIILSNIVPIPFIVAGVSLVIGAGAQFQWLSTGVIFAMAIGVSNAWVLLVEIHR